MNNCVRRARSYWTTCRCPDCVLDTARKRKLASMGYQRTITHQQAWTMLASKFADGWSALATASACGLDDDYFSRHLARWRRGEECLIGPATAVLIVNMGRPTKGQVGATPTRRRLRALATIGYGLNTLAAETGVNFSTLAAARNGNERVGARVANAVADVYDRLYATPGPDLQARRLARQKGWPAPWAWDDIENDPDELAAGRQYVSADRATAVRELADQGENATQIARRLNLSMPNLERWCLRNMPDVWPVISGREGDWNSTGNLSRQTKRGAA